MESKDFRSFFLLRLKELYNKDTLDSYRVRNHNTLTLLEELQRVIEGRLENRVKKNETVRYCIEETMDSIKNDKCMDFSFYDKNEFVKKLENLRGELNNKDNQIKEDLFKEVIFYIRKCLVHNKRQYLLSLLDVIYNILFFESDTDDGNILKSLGDLDECISSLATELIHIGYSKFYLFRYFSNQDFGGDIISDIKQFYEMKNLFCNHDKRDYIVVFRLQIKQIKGQQINCPEFEDDVPSYLTKKVTRNKAELRPNQAVKFFRKQISALDPISAIKECRIILSDILDARHNGNCLSSIEIPSAAFSFKVINGGADYEAAFFQSQILDSTNGGEIVNPQELINSLSKIDLSLSITQDVKDRIKFALRHLRIGDAQPEMEQRFINYWVGLEFIFSSPSSSESTFMRIKKFFTNVETCSYAKRNLYWFNKWLVKTKVIQSNQFFWEVADIETKILGYKNILALYRYKKLKSVMLNHSDERKNYLKHHKTNIERHLFRLYRLRNELIHEAATKENIESSTSNLRYYLVFLISHIVYQFSKDDNNRTINTINDFFMEYECLNDKISIKKYALQDLLNADLADCLLS